jgi:hypothetical protein
MIKTHKNIRNVIGDLLDSEDFNKNLLEVLKKNSTIDYDAFLSTLPNVFEKDYRKSPDSISNGSYMIYKNLGINQAYSNFVAQILDNNGELLSEMRLYKYLETIIINTQFLLNLNFKISFLKQKKGLSSRTYLIAKAAFYYPDAVRQEARVYVRKKGTELYEITDGENIIDYQSNSEIMNQAREQLMSNMHNSINKTIEEFKHFMKGLNYKSNIASQYVKMFEKLEKKSKE